MADFTQTDFDTWLPLQDVFKRAKTAFGEHAYETIMDALSSGLMQARATHYYDGAAQANGDRVDHKFSRAIMPAFWAVVAEAQFLTSLPLWTTGNVKQDAIDRSSGLVHTVTYQLFGIRLGPHGVAELLGAPVAAAPSPVTPPVSAPPKEQAPDGKPVSPALLAKWAALYVEAFTPEEDTLDKAWASAKGMFPGKMVTRDKAVAAVAKLRPRERGRKSDSGK